MSSSAWPVVPLGELCDVHIGKTPPRAKPEYWGPGYPWLSIADMNQGRDLATTKETITAAAISECHCKLVEPGTALLSFKLSVGRVGIAQRAMYTNEAIAHLPIKDPARISVDYLCRVLEGANLAGRVDRAAMGATLNTEKLLRIPVPLPSLQQQERIATVLDKVDMLRNRRRSSQSMLEALTISTFLEMFGHPASNPKNLPTITLGSLGDWKSGGTPSRSCPAYFGGSIPWYSSGELGPVMTGPSVESITEQAIAETSAKFVRQGSIMLGMYDSAALKSSIASEDCSCNQAVAFAQLDPVLANSRFVYTAIQIGKAHFRRLQRGIRQKNLNLSMIRAIQIPNPPLAAQCEFERRASAIDDVHRAGAAHQGRLDELFAALQATAFKGEL